jgi:hypothetical protein
MTKPFMVVPLLVLAAATGCGARPAFPQLQPAPAEASGQAANPAGAGSVMTIQWDSAREGLRVEAVDAGSGAPAPGWEPLFLGEGGKEVGGYAYSPGGDRLAVLSGTTPFCTRSAGGSACWPGTDTLHVVDLQSGEDHVLAFDQVAHVPLVAFAPTHKALPSPVKPPGIPDFHMADWRFRTRRLHGCSVPPDSSRVLPQRPRVDRPRIRPGRRPGAHHARSVDGDRPRSRDLDPPVARSPPDSPRRLVS